MFKKNMQLMGCLILNADKGNLIEFSGTGTIQGGTSSVTYTPSTSSSTVNNVVFTSGYANPEMKRDTGEIIYVENRRPISRNF